MTQRSNLHRKIETILSGATYDLLLEILDFSDWDVEKLTLIDEEFERYPWLFRGNDLMRVINIDEEE